MQQRLLRVRRGHRGAEEPLPRGGFRPGQPLFRGGVLPQGVKGAFPGGIPFRAGTGGLRHRNHRRRSGDAVHVRDPEEHPGAHHHHQALFHRPVHDHRHLHQAEPGAGGDHAGEAEAGDPFVGSGQDQDRHGRPPVESLHRTAPDPPGGDHRPPERGGGAEHELHFQGGDPGVFKPRLRSGAPDRAHQLQDRQSQGPDLILQFPGDAALYQTPFGRIFQSAVKSSGG